MLSKINKFYGLHKIVTIRNYSPRGTNPGINKQLKLLKDNIPEEFIADAEGFGDIETDFMYAHKSHKQYENEIHQHGEMIKKKIIKQKYFKQKQPNFLTFAEKEQIKLLHNRDPNEWTEEKLTESFPTDLQSIKKIIKTKWIPKSEKRILDHDKSVIENWKLLKMGKLPELHPDLFEHIQKFTNRTKEDLKNLKIDWEIRPPLPKPKNNEFLSIITSCKEIQNRTKLITDNKNNEIENKNPFITNVNTKSKQADDEETYLIEKVKNKNPLRYQDLKKNNTLSLEQNNDNKNYKNNKMNEHFNNENNLNDKDEFVIDNSNKTIVENDINFNVQKFETNEIIISQSDMKKFNVTPIKERIHIPRKLWKKGSTYKVQDCYYDYDGEFLYRVPGMINN